ncbi:hypothetical protein [Acetivibrio mesophilus]|uniref:Spo0E like sporulation regulatory protein n=1 Tax=Acetivibrio mesophilus TaxID=2487273 RepID=A0A4Q0I8X4_9FIRM|nr:hypothetical protein [Acetivibrio mesophilus]RXE60477.1 hypothetical protein EFD62_00640 [Acetivibrio mesophilus]
MAKTRYDKELEREKEKLNKLLDEAFNKGIPFTEDEAVMKQNRIVDTLVVKIQKKKRNHNKNQPER